MAVPSAPAASASALALVGTYAVMMPQQLVRALEAVGRERAVPVVRAAVEEGIMHRRRVWYYAAALGGVVAVTKAEHPIPLPDNAVVIDAAKVIMPQAVRLELSKLR